MNLEMEWGYVDCSLEGIASMPLFGGSGINVILMLKKHGKSCVNTGKHREFCLDRSVAILK